MIELDARQCDVFSEYRKFRVPDSMANCFSCFWEQVIAGSGEYTHRVLPDACIEDPPVVVGPWTDPFVIRVPAGTKIVGARLHPGRGPSVLGIPALELLNQSASLYWGQTVSRFISPEGLSVGITCTPSMRDRTQVRCSGARLALPTLR